MEHLENLELEEIDSPSYKSSLSYSSLFDALDYLCYYVLQPVNNNNNNTMNNTTASINNITITSVPSLQHNAELLLPPPPLSQQQPAFYPKPTMSVPKREHPHQSDCTNTDAVLESTTKNNQQAMQPQLLQPPHIMGPSSASSSSSSSSSSTLSSIHAIRTVPTPPSICDEIPPPAGANKGLTHADEQKRTQMASKRSGMEEPIALQEAYEILLSYYNTKIAFFKGNTLVAYRAVPRDAFKYPKGTVILVDNTNGVTSGPPRRQEPGWGITGTGDHVRVWLTETSCIMYSDLSWKPTGQKKVAVPRPELAVRRYELEVDGNRLPGLKLYVWRSKRHKSNVRYT